MHRKILLGLLGIFCIFSIASEASAEVKLKWGPYLRVRYEYWKNWKDMDNDQLDNRSFFRIKTSLWGQADLDEKYSLFAKLTNETKAYTYYAPASSKPSGKTEKGLRYDINEVVFDNLYLDFKKVLDAPVNIRLGRQDLFGYGENFLIADGTPQDGSRTYYFNAMKTSWAINEANTFDLIYIRDPKDDTYLPIINEDKSPQNLNTTDEEGYVGYYKNKSIKNLTLDGYYIYKREEADGGVGYQAEKGIINTLGSFARYDFPTWAIKGQAAYQFGDYGAYSREALGGYGYIEKNFKEMSWSPMARTGFIYLSGNKTGTNRNEGWDPLFSRYPWFSELYSLSMAAETGIVDYWTNMSAYAAEFSIKPTAKTKVSLNYYFLRANEQVTANSILSGSGKTRGHLPEVKVEYALTKAISMYVLAEYRIPGNFYKSEDAGLFVRTEFQIKF